MNTLPSSLQPIPLDANTVAFYLTVPRNQIGLLQSFFELYDGVGTVRTLQDETGTICILTTPHQVDDCRGVLMAIRERVAWTATTAPSTT